MMTTILTRLYTSADEASAAAGSLLENGFAARDVDIVNPPVLREDSTSADTGSISDSIMAAGAFKSVASACAARVAGGDSAVIVRATFGMAKKGSKLLDDHNPIDAALRHPNAYIGDMTKPDEPFKWALPELLSITFLTGEDPPFKGRSWTVSGMIGLPFFTNRGSGTKLISKRFSESMGMKMLWDHRA